MFGMAATLLFAADLPANTLFDFGAGASTGLMVLGIDPSLGLDPSTPLPLFSQVTFYGDGTFTATDDGNHRRARNFHMGDADFRLREHRLYGLSTEVEASIAGSLTSSNGLIWEVWKPLSGGFFFCAIRPA